MSVKVIAEPGIGSSLHDQNAVAFNGGKTLFGMAAGPIGISTGIALHAAGSQRQCITELLLHAPGQLPGNFFMVPAGIQAALQISNIRHISCGSEQKHVGKMPAALHALLNCTDHRRTRPGMTVARTFIFTDETNLIGKNKLLPLQQNIFADRKLRNQIFNPLMTIITPKKQTSPKKSNIR